MFLQIDMSKFGAFPSFVCPKHHRFFRLNRRSFVGKLDLKQFIFEKQRCPFEDFNDWACCKNIVWEQLEARKD